MARMRIIGGWRLQWRRWNCRRIHNDHLGVHRRLRFPRDYLRRDFLAAWRPRMKKQKHVRSRLGDLRLTLSQVEIEKKISRGKIS